MFCLQRVRHGSLRDRGGSDAGDRDAQRRRVRRSYHHGSHGQVPAVIVTTPWSRSTPFITRGGNLHLCPARIVLMKLFVQKSKHGAERIITINISPVMFGARLRVVHRRGEFPARPRKSYTGVLSYSEVGSPPSTRLVTHQALDSSSQGSEARLGREVLLEHVGRMEHVELLRGILTREEHDGLLATRMVRQKL